MVDSDADDDDSRPTNVRDEESESEDDGQTCEQLINEVYANRRMIPWWSRKAVLHWITQRQAQLDDMLTVAIASVDDYEGMNSYLQFSIDAPSNMNRLRGLKFAEWQALRKKNTRGRGSTVDAQELRR